MEEFRNIETARLDEYQYRIYEGLKHIGEEIATLYLDGIRIFKSNLPSKAYLLAHIAREIEGGMRDIFVPPGRIKYEICEVCGSKIKKFSHIKEICEVLGVDEENEFAKEWHKIAKQFHSYAHRHGAYKSPRDKKEFDELWEKFEKFILYKIVGEYLGLVHLIDRVLNTEMPTVEMIESTKNMLKNQSIENYFFSKVANIKWFYPLKGKGYFSPEKVPGPVPADEEDDFRIPYWSPLYYLERISAYIKEDRITGEEKVKYAKELLEIIRNVSTYKDSHGNHIDNYHVWTSFIKILSNIPNELIDIDTIDLIPIWLDSEFPNDLQAKGIIGKLLPKFFTDVDEDIKKAERIVQHLTTTKVAEEDRKEKKLLVDEPYYIKELFKEYSEKIGEKCSVEIMEDLKRKIKFLLRDKREGTYLSFYTYQGHLLDQPVELLSYGLREIMLAKASKEPEKLKPILEEFLKESDFIFPKIALFIVARDIDNFKDLFLEVINTDVGIKIFKNILFWGDELKHVLQNLGALSEHQREIFEEKINAACDELRKEKNAEDQEEVERRVSLCKQKIYKALSHDEHFKTLYEKIKSTTKMDVELESAIVKVEARGGWGESPLSEEEILKMPNNELAKYLAEFKTKNFWEGPTIEALAETLKKAVKIKPEKFTENLTPFMNTGYLYVYELLNGFNNALKEDKSVNLGKVFDFILDYINREDFWKDMLVVHPGISELNATHERVISSISSLIMGVIRSRPSTVSSELFDIMEKVVLLILEKIDYGVRGDVDDYIDYSSNSTLGRIIESYIELILQGENSFISDEKISRFKSQYEGFFNKNSIEAYTLFGFHFLRFYHFLKGWTEERVKLLENIKHTPQWEAFVTGYLFNNKIIKEIYKLLREHYKLSINYDFKSRVAISGLIAHISIAYLHGEESLESSSLFFEIVKDLNIDYIVEIINFFWRIGDDEEKIENYRDKVLDFWRFVYEKLKHKKDNNLLTQQDKKILSELSKLAIFLPSITEEYKEWLVLSAMYIGIDYAFSFFIEYLDVLKDRGDKSDSAKYVGEIFLKMIEGYGEEKRPPDYPKEHIKSIVEFLYSSPTAREYAKDICNIYASKDMPFLKEIYEKHEYGS